MKTTTTSDQHFCCANLLTLKECFHFQRWKEGSLPQMRSSPTLPATTFAVCNKHGLHWTLRNDVAMLQFPIGGGDLQRWKQVTDWTQPRGWSNLLPMKLYATWKLTFLLVWEFQPLKSNTILQTSLFCVPNYSCTWPAWFPPWPFQYLWKSKGLADVNVPKQLVQADAMVTSQEKMCQLLFSRRYCYKWIIEGDAVSLPTWLPWDRKFCLLFGSFGSVVDGSSTMFATTVVSSLIALVDGEALSRWWVYRSRLESLQSWDFYPFFRLYTVWCCTCRCHVWISSYGHRFLSKNIGCACVFILPPLNQLWSNLKLNDLMETIAYKNLCLWYCLCIISSVYIHFHSIPTNMSCHYYGDFLMMGFGVGWCRSLDIIWHPFLRCFGYDWWVQNILSGDVRRYLDVEAKTCKPSISILLQHWFWWFWWMINLGTEALLCLFSERKGLESRRMACD